MAQKRALHIAKGLLCSIAIILTALSSSSGLYAQTAQESESEQIPQEMQKTQPRKNILQIQASLYSQLIQASRGLQQIQLPLQNQAEAAKVKMNEQTQRCQVKFSIDFESGSLDSVSLKNEMIITAQMQPHERVYEFDVFSRHDPANPADPKLAPSARWYFFKMKGVNNKDIILNMHHSDTRRPFYSYDGLNYVRFTKEECAKENRIVKKFENDSVFIAYFTPYTESYLNSRIAEWGSRECVAVKNIGQSEHNRNMPLLVITDPTEPPTHKKVVYIHGRTHTSETPGSWHLDEMIEILSGNSQYARDLRKGIEFYIIPFTNPDGVQEGMSRSNANGINLEVNYNYNDSLTAQEVKNIKAFLEKLTAEKKVDIVLNMHSQSLNQTTYWVHKPDKTSDRYYKELMLFSNLTINQNPYFRKDDLLFSNVSPKYVEGWFWDNCKENTLAITFETPYTFYNRNEEGEWVSLENLKAMAINNVYAIGDYLQIPSSERIIVPEPQKAKKFKTKKDRKHIYAGESYLVARKKGAKVKYQLNNLPAGTYQIYKWSVGKNVTASAEGENEWVKTATHHQAADGKFEYLLEAQNSGDKADNILLIKQ